MSLFSLIESRLREKPDQIAIECPDRTGPSAVLSFADLAAAAGRAAGVLVEAGLNRGDRVVVQTEKSPETLAIYLACLRNGFVFVPVNTAYRAEETAYIMEDAKPAFCVADPARLTSLSEITSNLGVPVMSLDSAGQGAFADAAAGLTTVPSPERCQDEDLAAILYTSGTTGRPKGAMLSHRNLASNGMALTEAWRFTGEDVLLHALPIFHVHGLFIACSCALLAGARMIWLPKFSVGDVLAHLSRSTVFMGVPTYYVRLLERTDFTAASAAHMRLFTSGSAPLLSETFDAFTARTGMAIVERYGMTETGINTSNPYDGERRAGTVGFPLAGVEIRIADDEDTPLPPDAVGGLQVRGPNVFSGYWRRPERSTAEFAKGGWFKTGDVARVDTGGYVHLVGRSKDLIISGGYNVYPKEIEILINKLRGVEEAAVIGVPHADFGEVAVAIVTPQPGAKLDPDTIVAEVREKLANYKAPKKAYIVNSLPRNVMGKVQKNLLRETYKNSFQEEAAR
ncbi:MAG: AMP-binding protein [Caulobacteraceae bacterium]|nr:AMP-binding protein [Caulobacteraceae bacterium]